LADCLYSQTLYETWHGDENYNSTYENSTDETIVTLAHSL